MSPSRVVPFCIGDVVCRMRPETSLGRIGAKKAGPTAHAMRIEARRRPLESEVERNEMALCLFPAPSNAADRFGR